MAQLGNKSAPSSSDKPVSNTRVKKVRLQRSTVFLSLSSHRSWDCRSWKRWKRRKCRKRRESVISRSHQPWTRQHLSSSIFSPRHHPHQFHHTSHLSGFTAVSNTNWVTYLSQQCMVFPTLFFCQPCFRLHLTIFCLFFCCDLLPVSVCHTLLRHLPTTINSSTLPPST